MLDKKRRHVAVTSVISIESATCLPFLIEFRTHRYLFVVELAEDAIVAQIEAIANAEPAKNDGI